MLRGSRKNSDNKQFMTKIFPGEGKQELVCTFTNGTSDATHQSGSFIRNDKLKTFLRQQSYPQEEVGNFCEEETEINPLLPLKLHFDKGTF